MMRLCLSVSASVVVENLPGKEIALIAVEVLATLSDIQALALFSLTLEMKRRNPLK